MIESIMWSVKAIKVPAIADGTSVAVDQARQCIQFHSLTITARWLAKKNVYFANAPTSYFEHGEKKRWKIEINRL